MACQPAVKPFGFSRETDRCDDNTVCDDLTGMRIRLDEEMRATWQRSLPFGELVSDRWERAQRLGFGGESSIYDSAIVLGDVRVGSDTWIGPWVLLDGSGGGIRIGDNCDISAGVHVYSHDTVYRRISGGALDRRTGAVTIGDNTYVGPHTVITRGVTIGSMCVVAANSVVNRAVPDRSIVGGSPARTIGAIVGEGADVELAFEPSQSPELG